MMVTVLLFAGVLLGALGAVFCYRLGLIEGSRLTREGRLEKAPPPKKKKKDAWGVFCGTSTAMTAPAGVRKGWNKWERAKK